MNDPKYQLFKIGMEICVEFENKTGKPFYYYQFNHKNTSNVCPICRGDWKLPKDSAFIGCKCEKCRIVADETDDKGAII